MSRQTTPQVRDNPVVFAWIDNEQRGHGTLYADGTLRVAIPAEHGHLGVKIKATRLLDLVQRARGEQPMTTIHLSGGRWVDVPLPAEEVMQLIEDHGDSPFVDVTDDSGEAVRVNRNHVTLVIDRHAR